MISYSWRVSCFWPYLNLCAWTPLFLSRAQPIVSSTTGRKWTLAPWNGTGVKSLISCIPFWGNQTEKLLLFFCLKWRILKWWMANEAKSLEKYLILLSLIRQMFQEVFKSCTEPAAGAVPSAYATAVTTVRLPAEEEGAETHSCCRPEDFKDGKCEWPQYPHSVFFISGGVNTSLPIFL